MLKRFFPALVVAIAVSLSAGTSAHAAGPVSCPPGQLDPVAGVCSIVVTTPGTPATPGTPGTPVPAGTPAGPQKCVSPYTGKEVPCQDGASWWSNALGCYISLTHPQPPKSDPLWAGHTDGAIYDCYTAMPAGTTIYPLWSATSPAGPAAPPDPAQLAQQALGLMQLKAITVGIVPEVRPGSIGIIGMPTWMWAENPGPATVGPITKSASAGGFTVTATAHVNQIVWRMGDGSTVTCQGAGTPYANSDGRQPSPDCGHTYTRTGRYAVQATSYWVVDWSGIGQSGQIPTNFTQTATITMGEVQVITQ